MNILKFTTFLFPFFVFINCATPVILKQNIKSKSKNLEIEVLKLADGPNSFASGGATFQPKSNELRLVHVTISFKNLKSVDYEVPLTKIALEPTYITIMDDKGKEVKKLNPPAFVRHFEVGFTEDIKEDLQGNNYSTGKVETKLNLKPNESATRTLIYFLPYGIMPEKLILLDENSTAISLK